MNKEVEAYSLRVIDTGKPPPPGAWYDMTVVAWNSDKSQMLARFSDGVERWIETDRITRWIPTTLSAIVILPGMASRHFGMQYDGVCIER